MRTTSPDSRIDTSAAPDSRNAMPHGTSSPVAISPCTFGLTGLSDSVGDGLLSSGAALVAVDCESESDPPQPAINPAPSTPATVKNLRRSTVPSSHGVTVQGLHQWFALGQRLVVRAAAGFSDHSHNVLSALATGRTRCKIVPDDVWGRLGGLQLTIPQN